MSILQYSQVFSTYRTALLLPSVMYMIDSHLLVKEVNAKFFDNTLAEQHLHAALMCPTATMADNYERLELLGMRLRQTSIHDVTDTTFVRRCVHQVCYIYILLRDNAEHARRCPSLVSPTRYKQQGPPYGSYQGRHTPLYPEQTACAKNLASEPRQRL